MGNDGLQIGLVALRVLLIDDDLVRAVAAFGKAVDEALIGLIQRAVLDNLDDAMQTLHKRVDNVNSRIWWAVTFVIGQAVTLALLYLKGENHGIFKGCSSS